MDAERHGRWLDVIGPDHWTLRCGPWTLLAINAQLLGAELEAAEAQWTWLDGMFTRGLPGPTVLVSHKPWAAPEEELAATPPYRFVPPAARARFAEIAGDDHPTLVVSGHVHQHRELRLSGTHHDDGSRRHGGPCAAGGPPAPDRPGGPGRIAPAGHRRRRHRRQ